MKTKKVLIVLTMLCLLTAGAFAQRSGLNMATAGALKSDADYLLDVNEWSTLSIDKFYGFSQLGTNITGNLGFGTNVEGFRVAGYWNGNLWTDYHPDTGTPISSNNTILALVGQDNWGVCVDWMNDGAAKSNTFGATFGYNVSSELNASVGAHYTSIDVDSGSDTLLAISAGIIYHLEQKGSIESSAKADFTYGSNTVKASDTITSEASEIAFTPAYQMQYKPAKNFTYGLVVEAPLTSTTTTIKATNTSIQTLYFAPMIHNGLSIGIAKNLLLNLGIETELPPVTKRGDTTSYGYLYNSFRAGLTIPLSNVGTLDTYSTISYAPSMNTIWETPLHIVVSLHF